MSYVPRRLRHDPRWHIAGLTLGLLFAMLLMLARLYPAELNGIDRAVESAILPYQTLGTIEAFLVITALGSAAGVTLAAVGLAFFLRKNRFALIQLFLILLCSSISMGIAKAFVERARPEALLWLDPLNTYSFPSGHSTLAAAFYGFASVQLYRRARSSFGRRLAVGVPSLTILLIGMSRIVLNAHYFTDVVAGILLGLFWLAVAFMLPRPR